MTRGIYLIAGGGYHKIGRTSDLEGRLKTLRTNVPFEIKLLAFGTRSFQKDCVRSELELHQRFNHARVRERSEWFKLSDEDTKLCIELLKEMQPTPVRYTCKRKPGCRKEALKKWAEECLERLKSPVASSVALSS